MNSIEASGHPLGFAMDDSKPDPIFTGRNGETVVVTEARILGGHQKEAIVHEGKNGPRWRFASDEGKHLNGTDLAPFPLGFFNAGIHTDLMARIFSIATDQKIQFSNPELHIRNFYWFEGSFINGTGQGFADPTEIKYFGGPDLLDEAAIASPAIDALRNPLKNTFALYVNGRRLNPTGVIASESPNATDPFQKYSVPPVPHNSNTKDIIKKTGLVEPGKVKPAKAKTSSRIIRTVSGKSKFEKNGAFETDTWLEMPGVSHFSIRGNIGNGKLEAPSGLAILSSGIAFCFLTQLSRYIQHMKLDISGPRLVQFSPFKTNNSKGFAGPVDTHLFLNGHADAETHANLLRIAKRTCYLHATLDKALPPRLNN